MAATLPHDWGKIWHVFEPPTGLDETKVHINYQTPAEKLQQAKEIVRDMSLVVRLKTEELGLKGTNPLNMDDELRREYADALKSDSRWQQGFHSLLDAFQFKIDHQDAMNKITRPWWNVINFANNPSNDMITADGKYNVTPSVYPSIVSQLIEAGMPGLNIQDGLKPCSVVSIVRTSDKKIIYGLRGGANFANVYMSVPAGSVELHLEPGEGDSLFGSNRKELVEELAFTREHYNDSRLVAMTEETHLAKNGWLYYVFDTETALSEDEIKEHWKNAVDRGEHQRLEGIDYSNPEKHLGYLFNRAFDKSKANPQQVNKVTEVNYNTFLPQAILSTVAYFTSQYGRAWAGEMERQFGGHFDLTSCFCD